MTMKRMMVKMMENMRVSEIIHSVVMNITVNKYTNGCNTRCSQFYTVGMTNVYGTIGRMVTR
jgi:hypothetical protein